MNTSTRHRQSSYGGCTDQLPCYGTQSVTEGPDVDGVGRALSPAQGLDEGIRDPTLNCCSSCPDVEAVARVKGELYPVVSKTDCTAATSRFRVSEFPLAKLKTCRNHWLPVWCIEQVKATRPVETRAQTSVFRLWRSSQAVVPRAGPANWVEWAGASQQLWVPVQTSISS